MADQELTIGALVGASAVRERRTTQELVFEFLRDAILSGRLPGGARLVQDKIAAELSVSRVPVREALLQLEAEGFVRMEAHRGASVIWLSPEEVAEIFELRVALVKAAVCKAVPNLTDDQIDRLVEIAQAQGTEHDMSGRARLNHDFYRTLFERLDRPRWRATMDKLEREVERFLQPIDRPHLGHLELVKVCRSGDGERAAELVGRHLAHVGERAVARLRAAIESGEIPAPVDEPADVRRIRASVDGNGRHAT
ncbi:MAG: GntR family transcriptional regulator [Chloroflexi bacterium]|nr:GntR family transcriptional regulator [Chloroflexota bacterium]